MIGDRDLADFAAAVALGVVLGASAVLLLRRSVGGKRLPPGLRRLRRLL